MKQTPKTYFEVRTKAKLLSITKGGRKASQQLIATFEPAKLNLHFTADKLN